MRISASVLTLLLTNLIALLLAGCSTPITVTEAADTARSIGHIKPSPQDTCETQRQVAAQSSRIDTIIAGKERVYKAKPCKDTSTNQTSSATS